MKLKQAINELAQFELSPNGTKKDISSANAMEKSILSTIEKAIEISPELQAKFSINQNPFDIQVVKEGPNFKITTAPEDGSKPTSALYPMTYLAKYVGNPKGMAIILSAR